MARGAETLIFELQGYLFFGTASRLGAAIGREIEEAGAEVRQLAVDFRRVPGLDMSAAHQLVRLAHAAERRGLALSLTGLDATTRSRLLDLGVDARVLAFATLDVALLESEERALAAADAEPWEATRLGALVQAIEASGMGEIFARETVPAGATILRQGETSGDLLLLERGRLFASVAGPDDREVRVATFLPGAMVGEIGYYAGTARTATVRAEVESVVCRIAAEALARLAREEPAIAREFHRRMAGLLARRLARTTAELNAVS
jgi:SulP family sulfate permease